MAEDCQLCGWLCAGGAGGDSGSVFLHGALHLELADMKTIIEMAREAGLWPAVTDTFPKELKRFAALVLANNPPDSSMAWQEGNEAGRRSEREACAKVSETLADDYYDCTGVANAITAAIRARGQA